MDRDWGVGRVPTLQVNVRGPEKGGQACLCCVCGVGGRPMSRKYEQHNAFCIRLQGTKMPSLYSF